MLSTNRLLEVLDYIKQYMEDNGYPPTVRDMCNDLDIKSTATAYSYINRLRDMGYLEKADKKKRAVVIKRESVTHIPLVGTVTAGYPILAAHNFEGYYPIPSGEFRGEDLFMLRVKGDSMIEAGIFNGDKIIVKKQETANNGDIVVALFTPDSRVQGATVKRYFRKGDKVILHPENSALSDYVLDSDSEAMIIGKVVGLIRTL
ncbi:MAG: transcriptional repressor LexA [Clostridia bacterium]|nr:transcriptional repressor LexA [Clostridia bacterium]